MEVSFLVFATFMVKINYHLLLLNLCYTTPKNLSTLFDQKKAPRKGSLHHLKITFS